MAAAAKQVFAATTVFLDDNWINAQILLLVLCTATHRVDQKVASRLNINIEAYMQTPALYGAESLPTSMGRKLAGFRQPLAE